MATPKKVVRLGLDTRKPQQPATSADLPSVPGLPGDLGRLQPVTEPLGLVGTGETVKPQSLVDLEKAGLRLAGVDISKPVPKSVLEALPEIIKKMKPDGSLDDVSDMPAVNIPPAVNLDELPEKERNQRARDIEMLLKAQARLMSESTASVKPATMPIPVAVDPFPIIDDRKATPPAPTPEPPPAPVPEHNHSEAGGSTEHKPVFCPRCSWDCRRTDPVDVTDQDRIDFVDAVLSQTRFKKEYSLFGGRMKVTFHELLTMETNDINKFVLRQLMTDTKNHTVEDYYSMTLQYRQVVALDSIETKDQILDLSTQFADFPPEKPEDKVGEYSKLVLSDVLKTDSLQVVTGRAYLDFQALCDKLRLLSIQPDFWNAIR